MFVNLSFECCLGYITWDCHLANFSCVLKYVLFIRIQNEIKTLIFAVNIGASCLLKMLQCITSGTFS